MGGFSNWWVPGWKFNLEEENDAVGIAAFDTVDSELRREASKD
jgi:hypothetical protein